MTAAKKKSGTCTEIAILPLRDGVNIREAGSEGDKAVKAMVYTLQQQKGFLNAYNRNINARDNELQSAIEWESIQDHKNFMTSEPYGPFVESIMTIMRGPATIYHVHFQPSYFAIWDSFNNKNNLTSSSQEKRWLITRNIYYPIEVKKEQVEEAWQKIEQDLRENAVGFCSAASGWVVEELAYRDSKHKSTVFATITGVNNLDAFDAHMRTEKSLALWKVLLYASGENEAACDLYRVEADYSAIKERK